MICRSSGAQLLEGCHCFSHWRFLFSPIVIIFFVWRRKYLKIGRQQEINTSSIYLVEWLVQRTYCHPWLDKNDLLESILHVRLNDIWQHLQHDILTTTYTALFKHEPDP